MVVSKHDQWPGRAGLGDGASFTGSSLGISPPRRAPPRGEGPESAALRLSSRPATRQAKLGPEQFAADLLDGTSIDRLECERDALAAADAHGDDPAPEAVATHRMDEAGCQHRTGGADRMPVGDRAAFDIDDVGRKPELARDGDDDRGAGPVVLDALATPHPPPPPRA